jgi:hypothetical protein
MGYTYVLWKTHGGVISEIIFAGATNVVVDELFFDPAKFSWNEYIFFTIIILIIVYNGKRKLG